MTDEVKTKRPVPPQFLKKKKETDTQVEKPIEHQSDAIITVVSIQNTEQKEVDMTGLVRDLMFNRYFCITEKEAKPIAERMVKEGAKSLLEIKWFLALSERQQLSKELKQKYDLF